MVTTHWVLKGGGNPGLFCMWDRRLVGDHTPLGVPAGRGHRAAQGLTSALMLSPKGKPSHLEGNPRVLFPPSSTTLTKITIKSTVALSFALSIQVKTASLLN